MKTLAILIPAYNEAAVIGGVIKDVQSALKPFKLDKNVVVINDGSTDKTAEIAKQAGAQVVTHSINRGYGAALQTGIEHANRTQLDYAITFDADGQHDPKDIAKVFHKLKQGYDIVVGSRFLMKTNQIPLFRRVILKLGNLATFIFFGIWISDSQSGFRGFNQQAIRKIKLKTNHMEVSSEFYSEVKKHRLSYIEVPISVKYTPYSLSKGQTNLNSFNVLLKLVYKLFR